MKKREIIKLLAYCVYGFNEVVALLFCVISIYFVLCLLAK